MRKVAFSVGSVVVGVLVALFLALPHGDLADQSGLFPALLFFAALTYYAGLDGLQRWFICIGLFAPVIAAFVIEVRQFDDGSGLWVVGLIGLLFMFLVGFISGEFGAAARRRRK